MIGLDKGERWIRSRALDLAAGQGGRAFCRLDGVLCKTEVLCTCIHASTLWRAEPSVGDRRQFITRLRNHVGAISKRRLGPAAPAGPGSGDAGEQPRAPSRRPSPFLSAASTPPAFSWHVPGA